MNKMIKLATLAIGAAAMSAIAGCGSTESEYESIVREISASVNNGKAKEEDVEAAMKEFRAQTPEKQKAELEKTRKEWNELKKLGK